MNKEPLFDKHGYPDEATEKAIAAWPFEDQVGWIDFIKAAWDHHYGRIWEEGGMLRLATGGWSGNESIISAMHSNIVLWSLLWESSHRGGMVVLRMPKEKQ